MHCIQSSNDQELPSVIIYSLCWKKFNYFQYLFH